MTGGLVIVLGKVGYNVGAGMTAGIAYILDEDQTLERKINTSYVKVRALKEEEEKELKYWIEEHFKATQSLWAKEILENWEKFKSLFKLVEPLE